MQGTSRRLATTPPRVSLHCASSLTSCRYDAKLRSMTDLNGTWSLAAWRRIAGDGSVSYPLGADARGLLVYTENGRMTVQIAASNRPVLASDDPLGGDAAICTVIR